MEDFKYKQIVFSDDLPPTPPYDSLKSQLRKSQSKLSIINFNEWRNFSKRVNPLEGITGEVGQQVLSQNSTDLSIITNAFLKFWEILDFLNLQSAPKSCLFLCECPGAFISATRARYNADFPWKGVSLNPLYEGNPFDAMIDDNVLYRHSSEQWYIENDFVSTNNVYKLSESGDIFKFSNFQEKFFLVTGDGSIDCSWSPEDQENITFNLLQKEFEVAISTVEEGGIIVIKIFTFYHEDMQNLLSFVSQCFSQSYLTKPIASKPGNSELYFVGVNFIGIPENVKNSDMSNLFEICHFFTKSQVDRIEEKLLLFHRNKDSIVNSLNSEYISKYFHQYLPNGLICNLLPSDTSKVFVPFKKTSGQFSEDLKENVHLKIANINHGRRGFISEDIKEYDDIELNMIESLSELITADIPKANSCLLLKSNYTIDNTIDNSCVIPDCEIISQSPYISPMKYYEYLDYIIKNKIDSDYSILSTAHFLSTFPYIPSIYIINDENLHYLKNLKIPRAKDIHKANLVIFSIQPSDYRENHPVSGNNIHRSIFKDISLCHISYPWLVQFKELFPQLNSINDNLLIILQDCPFLLSRFSVGLIYILSYLFSSVQLLSDSPNLIGIKCLGRLKSRRIHLNLNIFTEICAPANILDPNFHSKILNFNNCKLDFILSQKKRKHCDSISSIKPLLPFVKTPLNIGVFYGSFDPFHNNHLRMIQWAQSHFDKILIIVNSDDSDKKNYQLSSEIRGNLIKSLNLNKVVVIIPNNYSTSTWEKREAIVFNDYLPNNLLLPNNVNLIMGTDSFYLAARNCRLGDKRHYIGIGTIREFNKIYILGRIGDHSETQCPGRIADKLVHVDEYSDSMKISSTMVRELLRTNRGSVDKLIPESIYKEIADKSYYL